MTQEDKRRFLELSYNRDVDRCWVGLRDCPTAFDVLPAILREDLEPVVRLMALQGWRRLSLSSSPTDCPIADGQRVHKRVLTSHGMRAAIKVAVYHLDCLERFLTKHNILENLDRQIGQIDDEIVRLLEQITGKRKRKDELLEQMREVVLEAAVSSAGLESVFPPSQSARDRSSQRVFDNHRSGRTVK